MSELEQEVYDFIQSGVRTRLQLMKVTERTEYWIKTTLTKLVRRKKIIAIKKYNGTAHENFYSIVVKKEKPVKEVKANYNKILTTSWT